MVQQQRSAGVQPTHEAAPEGPHVDEREGVEQHLAGLYPGAPQVRPADRPPVVVRARHALGGAFGARGPADRRDVVGVDAERGAVRPQRSPPRIIRRRRGEGDRAFRERVLARRTAQTEHAQGDALCGERRTGLQRHPYMVGAFEGVDGEHRAGAGEADDLFQFVTAELHRHRADDDAEPQRRDVERRILGDVGQLCDEQIVTSESERLQRHREAIRQIGGLTPAQAQRRCTQEIRAVRRIDQGRAFREGAGMGVEHVVDAGVAPPVAAAVLADLLCRSRSHGVSPIAWMSEIRTRIISVV